MTSRETNKTIVVMSGAVLLMAAACNKKERRERRWWRSNLYKKRTGTELMLDLKSQQISGLYKNFMRMSPSDFENLLQKVGPHISKKETYLRTPISAQDRLAVMLRFLAAGDSYTSLQYLFRISKQSIARIIPEVCAALVKELKSYIKLPETPTAWKEVATTFASCWNLPHTVGALDGKHVIVQAPLHTGTEFFNYKSTFSIILFALMDANYNFLFVDAGCQGRISDGGIFQATKLHQMIRKGTVNLPLPENLPGHSMPIPYFFVGDSTFALSANLMKPYSGNFPKGTPERIFNYHLSRARRVVENVFGISSAVFHVLRKPLLLEPAKVELIVMTVVLLHNYLCTHSPHLYTPVGSLDSEINGILTVGAWRNDVDMTSMLPVRTTPRRSGSNYQVIRDEIAAYCMHEGSLEWQFKYA